MCTRQCGHRSLAVIAFTVAGCKAPASTSVGAAPSAHAEASAVVPPAASSSGRDAPWSVVDAFHERGERAIDPRCRRHTFCEVMQLLARAARGDGEAATVVAADVTSLGCDYPMGDVWAGRCGHDGCEIYFGGKVDEAELRRHLVRSGALPPNAPDLRAAPFPALPRVFVEARPMVAAIVACLPDFAADPMPDPFPVEVHEGFPYWTPALGELDLRRADGVTRQRAVLRWEFEDSYLDNFGEASNAREPMVWQYLLTFDGPGRSTEAPSMSVRATHARE